MRVREQNFKCSFDALCGCVAADIQKFAGLPPNLIISIVAMAKPAPLTKQPMLPSKLT